MKITVLRFVGDDGKEILFDEYTKYDDNTCWVTMCEKCLGKYKSSLGGREDDHGSGCCSVCGCDTPSWNDWGNERCSDGNGSVYVDFSADDVEEVEIETEDE